MVIEPKFYLIDIVLAAATCSSSPAKACKSIHNEFSYLSHDLSGVERYFMGIGIDEHEVRFPDSTVAGGLATLAKNGTNPLTGGVLREYYFELSYH